MFRLQKILLFCIAACYCGEDCGLFGNCCFEELDVHRFYEKENLVCMYPSTEDTLSAPFVTHAFYIIDTCPQVWYLVVLY